MPGPGDLTDLPADPIAEPTDLGAPSSEGGKEEVPTPEEFEAMGFDALQEAVGPVGSTGVRQFMGVPRLTEDPRFWPLLAYLRKRCYPHCRHTSPEDLTTELLHVIDRIS